MRFWWSPNLWLWRFLQEVAEILRMIINGVTFYLLDKPFPVSTECVDQHILWSFVLYHDPPVILCIWASNNHNELDPYLSPCESDVSHRPWGHHLTTPGCARHLCWIGAGLQRSGHWFPNPKLHKDGALHFFCDIEANQQREWTRIFDSPNGCIGHEPIMACAKSTRVVDKHVLLEWGSKQWISFPHQSANPINIWRQLVDRSVCRTYMNRLALPSKSMF